MATNSTLQAFVSKMRERSLPSRSLQSEWWRGGKIKQSVAMLGMGVKHQAKALTGKWYASLQLCIMRPWQPPERNSGGKWLAGEGCFTRQKQMLCNMLFLRGICGCILIPFDAPNDTGCCPWKLMSQLSHSPNSLRTLYISAFLPKLCLPWPPTPKDTTKRLFWAF